MARPMPSESTSIDTRIQSISLSFQGQTPSTHPNRMTRLPMKNMAMLSAARPNWTVRLRLDVLSVRCNLMPTYR